MAPNNRERSDPFLLLEQPGGGCWLAAAPQGSPSKQTVCRLRPPVRRASPFSGCGGVSCPRTTRGGRDGTGRESPRRPLRRVPGPLEASRVRAAPGSSLRAGGRDEGKEAADAGHLPNLRALPLSLPGPVCPEQLPPAPAPETRPAAPGSPQALVTTVASWPSTHLQKALWKERLRPGASCGNNGHRFSFPSPGGGRAEDVVVRSSPGDATDSTRLGLAGVVSARPRSPRDTGAKRDSSRLRAGAAAAEAGEPRLKVKKKKPKAGRQRPPSAREREPAPPREEGALFAVRSRSDHQRAAGSARVTGGAVRPRSARARLRV
ncbi:translation initiation factor IF-2-like [Aquila chrysaetos chrysaetos]|uniref:translation initiation factor IF-2-like n=1 Tax=Aquila chrysaetos chrysaetos TaxID=223781 RepID=UPI001B7D375A|nr:translation initiation factor IF-2-like [Aquila chrysaetos chrysaetos]